MKTQTGLWIDHRQAVVVMLSDHGDTIRHITSDLDEIARSVNETGTHAAAGYYSMLAEDRHDRRVIDHLHRYYDAIIASLNGGDPILIIGPGEAKHELRKRLEQHASGIHIAAVEPADHMTDRQIAAHVRNYYHSRTTNR